MPDNEFTDWFDAHDNELLVMECEDIARTAFFAGMKAAQQSVQRTVCPNCCGEKYAESLDGTRVNCEVCGGTGNSR